MTTRCDNLGVIGYCVCHQIVPQFSDFIVTTCVLQCLAWVVVDHTRHVICHLLCIGHVTIASVTQHTHTHTHTHTQVTLQEAEFRRNGGNPLWLRGVEYLPTKILGLLNLNKMLCHQPWFVSPDKMRVSYGRVRDGRVSYGRVRDGRVSFVREERVRSVRIECWYWRESYVSTGE